MNLDCSMERWLRTLAFSALSFLAVSPCLGMTGLGSTWKQTLGQHQCMGQWPHATYGNRFFGRQNLERDPHSAMQRYWTSVSSLFNGDKNSPYLLGESRVLNMNRHKVLPMAPGRQQMLSKYCLRLLLLLLARGVSRKLWLLCLNTRKHLLCQSSLPSVK